MPPANVLRAPGTNCDGETVFAFERAGAKVDLVHINRLLEQPELLSNFQILCLPGGFCYGDDIASGRILANQIYHHLGDQMRAFRDGQRPATVMHQIAKGYTDQQIDALAAWFAAQKR